MLHIHFIFYIVCFTVAVMSAAHRTLQSCSSDVLSNGFCYRRSTNVSVSGYTTLKSYYQRLTDNVGNPVYGLTWLAEKDGQKYMITQVFYSNSGDALSIAHIEPTVDFVVGVGRLSDSQFVSCYQKSFDIICNTFNIIGDKVSSTKLDISADREAVGIVLHWSGFYIGWFHSGTLKVRRYSGSVTTHESEATLETGITGSVQRLLVRRGGGKLFVGYIVDFHGTKVFRLVNLIKDIWTSKRTGYQIYEGTNLNLFDMAINTADSIVMSGNFDLTGSVYTRKLNILYGNGPLLQKQEFLTSGLEDVTSFKYRLLIGDRTYACAYTTANSVYLQILGHASIIGDRINMTQYVNNPNFSSPGQDHINILRFTASSDFYLLVYQPNGFNSIFLGQKDPKLLTKNPTSPPTLSPKIPSACIHLDHSESCTFNHEMSDNAEVCCWCDTTSKCHSLSDGPALCARAYCPGANSKKMQFKFSNLPKLSLMLQNLEKKL